MPENIQNHWTVITNPKAGKRKLSAQKNFIITQLDTATIPYTFIETEYAGHAIKIARENTEKGCMNFLVLGGDGSISEVINGIFSAEIEDTSKVKIAIIPRGTGNDWARFWKLKKNDKLSFKIFLEGYSRFIDIGKITLKHQEQTSFRYFINSVGFGLDAKVADLTHKFKHYVGSFSFLYTISLLIAVFRYKSINSRIEINGFPHYINLFTMNIANGPYSGGGIKQNPSALPFDGIFDVMFVEKPTLKDILTVLPRIFNGKITQRKVIQSFKTDKITLNCDKETFFETDGLVSKNAQNFEISILPKSIQMIVPQEFTRC